MAFIMLFNLIIDPLGIWKIFNVKGVNEYKPQQYSHQRLYKAVDLMKQKSDTIFLGNSKVQNGLDPEGYQALTGEKAYNLGLGGSTMEEQLRYLEHALYNDPSIKNVVMGIDFRSFNSNRTNVGDFDPNRLSKSSIFFTKDAILTTLTFDAIRLSYSTIIANKQGGDQHSFFEHNGKRSEFTIQQENQGRKAIDVFGGYIHASLKDPSIYGQYQLSQKHLMYFQAIVDICKESNLQLKVFISPSHVTLLESIRNAGHWNLFEQWKREIAEITPYWDFYYYNSITNEPINDNMKYYWDSTHYKKEVGNMVLSKMYDLGKNGIPSNFGVYVTKENIENHLQTTRRLRDFPNYLDPDSAALVKNIYNELTKSSTRSPVYSMKEMALRENINWSLDSSAAGIKYVKFPLADLPNFSDAPLSLQKEKAVMKTIQGTPITHIVNTSWRAGQANEFYITEKEVIISVENSVTGWGEGVVPSASEIKAYFAKAPYSFTYIIQLN
ncbi:hypothetical protein [Paenibacillus alginolyticus]|nr:hypothetical protein [Paenibacillus alginolyticus]MEC0143777.1 hypothetical protein [Paenibacillus alginolyticus]